VARFLYSIPGGSTLVFINGRFSPHLSIPAVQVEGVTVSNLAAAFATHGRLLGDHLGRYAKIEKSGFTALNTALGHDGVFVHVKAGAAMSGPVHAVFVSDGSTAGSATYPRNFILLESGASGAVIESYVALQDGSYFVNAVTEAVVGEGARLEHSKIQRESEQAYHVGTTHIQQERDSHSTSFSISLGAALCRNNLDVVLNGPALKASCSASTWVGGVRRWTTTPLFSMPRPTAPLVRYTRAFWMETPTRSSTARSSLPPRPKRPTPSRPTGTCSCRTAPRWTPSLSSRSSPDDVKCTHGATVGTLDPLAAFYLKSRGIGPLLGRKILTYAFAAEILEELPYPAVRSGLESLVSARLEESAEA
jgi:Fe-S cluster assembly protein SufD